MTVYGYDEVIVPVENVSPETKVRIHDYFTKIAEAMADDDSSA